LHVVQAVQVSAPAAEYVPAPHATQRRSLVAVGATDWCCPAAQTVSAAQTRLLVAVGAAVWYCAAVHTVTGVHAVAPGVAANVLEAHGVHAVAPVPSLENVPAGQSLQVYALPPPVQEVPDRHGEVAPLWHTPALQVSPTVHSSVSVHAVPVSSAHTPFVVAPVATEQASQAPASHAESQHTPSAQKPLSQSVASEHA
jgi:hypothetical protein